MRTVHKVLLAFSVWHGVAGWAQNVTTITSEPLDASGGLSVGADGSVYVANQGRNNNEPQASEVWKITPTGEVSLFADGMVAPNGNAFDTAGDLYQTSWLGNTIHRIAPDGSVTLIADNSDGVGRPVGITFDSRGNLYVAQCPAAHVRKITPEGVSTIFFEAIQGACPVGLAADDQDNLYLTYWYSTLVTRITPDGQGSDFANTMDVTGAGGPNGFITFANDRLYLAARGAHQVLELSLDGELSLLAGSGVQGNRDGKLSNARFSTPNGIGVSPDGRIVYVASSDPPQNSPGDWSPNHIRAIELPYMVEDIQINQGMTDAWFNDATPGQGMLIVVLPEAGIIFLAWFTYDTTLPPEDVVALLGAAEHRWVTAQGPYAGDTANLTVYLTQGGVFDMAAPRAVTDTENPIGTITIVWHSCSSATLTYDIDPPGVMGEIPLRRIVPDNEALCEALAPK